MFFTADTDSKIYFQFDFRTFSDFGGKTATILSFPQSEKL